MKGQTDKMDVDHSQEEGGEEEREQKGGTNQRGVEGKTVG